MGEVRITATVDSYKSAEKMSVGIYNNIVLGGVCYKPFTDDGGLYIPTVTYEPIYDGYDGDRCIAIEKHIFYQNISKELIKAVIECY